MNFRNRLLTRLQGICFNTQDSSGGDPGSGGDAGGGGGATPSPAADSGGGQQQEPANHAFNASPPSTELTSRVSNILSTKGNDDHLSMTEINDLISFDAPFKAPAAAPAQQQTPPANQQTPPVNQQQQTPQAPQPLTAEAIAAAVREAIGGQQPPANPTNPAPTNEPQPYYGGVVDALRINEPTLKAILGTDDPQILAQAGPALDVVINSLGNSIMQAAELRMQAYATAIMRSVPQQVQQIGTVNETERGFYALHPELNKPVFKTTVDTVAGVILAAAKKRDPNFKLDEKGYRFIGDQVHKKLQADLGFAIPRAVPAAAAPAAPAQRPNQQQQPFVPNGGSRAPAGRGNASQQSADLLSMVV